MVSLPMWQYLYYWQHACTLHFTAAGSAKVEVNDQQIQTEIVETEHKSVQVGSTPKQQGVYVYNCMIITIS